MNITSLLKGSLTWTETNQALIRTTSTESSSLIYHLLNIKVPRVIRMMAKRGELEEFAGVIEPGQELRFIETKLYLIDLALLILARKAEPTGEEDIVKTMSYHKRKEMEERNLNAIGIMLSNNFNQPKIYRGEVDFIDDSKDPELSLRDSFRTSMKADLIIPYRWRKPFGYSNENYLVGKIHSPETLADNVTVWLAKGWEKKAIRNKESKLINLYVACTPEVHTTTKARSTALRGLTVRTKNKVIGQVWDL